MPGTVVTVTLPQALLASGAVRLQIGGWTDALWDHTDWTRLPEVVRRCAQHAPAKMVPRELAAVAAEACWPAVLCCEASTADQGLQLGSICCGPARMHRYDATTTTTKIGSALGGLIYVVLPTGMSAGQHTITITGAPRQAELPRFGRQQAPRP